MYAYGPTYFVTWQLTNWFPALRCRSRIRFRGRFHCRFCNRFRKNRVRTCCSVCRCWGVCPAVARQAQEADRRVSRAKEWAELQTSWLRTERQVQKIARSILYERINGNGELTETENVIFYVSCGVLTEFLRMNVILTYFCNGQRRYGNGRTDT